MGKSARTVRKESEDKYRSAVVTRIVIHICSLSSILWKSHILDIHSYQRLIKISGNAMREDLTPDADEIQSAQQSWHHQIEWGHG